MKMEDIETLYRNITNDTDYISYIQRLSDQMAIQLLPAIIIVSLYMVIGCIGNSMVLYVYTKKFNPSSTRTAIIALASLDLTASCIAMPGEILDIRYSYSFSNEILCKTFRFGTTTILMASGFTLLYVAKDRYRRICHPLEDQFTPKQTKYHAIVYFIVAMVFSTPSIVLYGLSKVPTPTEGIHGYTCSIDDKHNKILPLINSLFQVAIFLSTFTAIIVLYTLLGRQVYKQYTYRYSIKRSSNPEERDLSITDGTKESIPEQFKHRPTKPALLPDTTFNSNNINAEDTRKWSVQSRKQSILPPTRKISIGDRRTRKTSLMLFIITAVFVASFLPHLILKGLQAAKKNFPSNESRDQLILYNVFVRSYFFNSIANCFIYGFCNTKFRRESKKLIMSLLCCFKK